MVPVSLFLSGRTDGRTDGRRPFRSDASVTPRERGPSPEGGREIGEQERRNRTNTDPMRRRERMGVVGNHYLQIMGIFKKNIARIFRYFDWKGR